MHLCLKFLYTKYKKSTRANTVLNKNKRVRYYGMNSLVVQGEMVDLTEHGARAHAVRLVVVVDVLAQLVHQHHALRLTIRVELETEILVLIGKKTNKDFKSTPSG